MCVPVPASPALCALALARALRDRAALPSVYSGDTSQLREPVAKGGACAVGSHALVRRNHKLPARAARARTYPGRTRQLSPQPRGHDVKRWVFMRYETVFMT